MNQSPMSETRERLFRTDAAFDPRLKPSALRLYLALCGDEAMTVDVPWQIHRYASALVMAESTVNEAKKALVRLGYIESIRRRGVTFIRALHASNGKERSA